MITDREHKSERGEVIDYWKQSSKDVLLCFHQSKQRAVRPKQLDYESSR